LFDLQYDLESQAGAAMGKANGPPAHAMFKVRTVKQIIIIITVMIIIIYIRTQSLLN